MLAKDPHRVQQATIQSSFNRRMGTYIFQAIALVVLQQPVFATVALTAKPAVTDNSLGTLLAVLVRAADFLWRHAAAKRNREVQSGVALDVVVGEGARWREMLPSVDEAEVGLRKSCSYREQGCEVFYGEILGDGQGNC